MDKHIHLMRIDTVCPKCFYRNQGEYILDEPMDIVCCGKCGTILAKPEEMSENEEEKIRLCVQRAIEEEDEDVLL